MLRDRIGRAARQADDHEEADSSAPICRLLSWIMTIIHEGKRNMLAHSSISSIKLSQ